MMEEKEARLQAGEEPQSQTEEAPGPRTEGPLEGFPLLLPQRHGHWGHEKGDSSWIFHLGDLRRDCYVDCHDGRDARAPWGDTIRKSNFPYASYLDFRRNYPDFSPYLIKVTSKGRWVDADFTSAEGLDFTGDRNDNFRQADGWAARMVGAAAGDVAYLRRNGKLTWHELETCDRMILVPRAIHGYVPHSGGIEVMNGLDANVERAASPPVEKRVIAGRNALCGRGVCRIPHILSVRETLREIPVSIYCNDDGGTPTQPQIDRMRLLEKNWTEVEEAAWDVLQRYVDGEWTEPSQKGCGETAQLAAICIFPVNSSAGGIDVGLFYKNFVEDPEHGLGVRILGDRGDIMEAGPGDVAL